MKRYNLSKEAQQDLSDIRAYLTEEAGARVARQVLNQIKDALDVLSRTPQAGHSREDLIDAPVKFWSVYSYMIIYRPTPTPIGIVRVVHASRDLSRLHVRNDE